MKHEIKNLPRGQAEIKIELTVEEYQPYLKQAAQEISQAVKVAGFRPGKAPYEIIKQQVGEAKIWEEALEPAVRDTMVKILVANKMTAIGSPQVEMDKMVPGQAVSFKVIVSLLPNLELCDYRKIKIEHKHKDIGQKEIDKALAELQKMRCKEALVNRPAKEHDKVELDFSSFLDNVPLEGGNQKKFPVILGDHTFMPDFEKNIIGLKSGDEKEFPVKFPENFHQKSIANRTVDFKVKVNAVFEIILPPIDDELAKGVGKFSGLAELTEQIKKNLQYEADLAEDQRLEEAIIDELVAKCKFGELPDVLINSEINKMISELEENIKRQGLNFEDYLQHMKKKRADLLLDFAPMAAKRVKAALITRDVAEVEHLEATEAEVDEEIKKILSHGDHQHEMTEKFKSPAFRGYLKNMIVSRKTMQFLKDAMVK